MENVKKSFCLINLNENDNEKVNFLKEKWKLKTKTKVFLKCLELGFTNEKIAEIK